ncbi:MAG TPA: DegT/DnrJ/EryC1/StrS family aminotransferase [Gemmatimonadaceae bacterium]|nr:DegT/DnrJ/EryC1/StrS family aminotransferase [Gemmatimonadaceae bacterium]
MIGRRQLPVSSPLSLGALVRAAVAAAAFGPRSAHDAVAAALRVRFDARAVALTDSGTSALVLALRLAMPRSGTVALPAYACVDLLAAAARAGVRVRFYDVVPDTLGPDLDSVRAALQRGADTIVVAHLYGYPADVPAVRALADAHGAMVIEDAAQQAGGTLRGTRLGAFGPLTVLSFGRGKGTTGGRGGALLAFDTTTLSGVSLPPSGAGWSDLARAAAQWAAGRPALYGIPASIPALRLGETVYHEAHEPHGLSTAPARLVVASLARADADRVGRAATSDRLRAALADAPSLRIVREIDGAQSGYLRLPVLDAAHRESLAASGVVRSYPRSLDQEPAAAALVHRGEPSPIGAHEVCDTLWTLPTHDMVTDRDIAAILAWSTAHEARARVSLI